MAAPRFTLASISSSPGRRLYLAHARLRQHLSDQFRKSGYQVTTEEWALLSHLLECGSLTQAQIALRMEKDGPFTSRLVDSLEGHGYVQRRISSEDRRNRVVELTKAGRAAQASLTKIAMAHMAYAFDGISARDFKSFLRVLNRMIERLPPRHGDASPLRKLHGKT